MGGLGILQQSIQLSTTNAALNAVCTKTLDKITAEACLHSTALMGTMVGDSTALLSVIHANAHDGLLLQKCIQGMAMAPGGRGVLLDLISQQKLLEGGKVRALNNIFSVCGAKYVLGTGRHEHLHTCVHTVFTLCSHCDLSP